MKYILMLMFLVLVACATKEKKSDCYWLCPEDVADLDLNKCEWVCSE